MLTMVNMPAFKVARNTPSAVLSLGQYELRSTTRAARNLIARFDFSPAMAELISQFARLGGACQVKHFPHLAELENAALARAHAEGPISEVSP
jgi:hypothetical protein